MLSAPRNILLSLVLLAACGHDSERDNPLDPELTPAVELAAALDDTAGTVLLTWSAYAGRQPFAAYHIQRRVQGQALWTTLDSLQKAAATSWTDSALSPHTAYEYRVAVVNASGHAEPSGAQPVSGYTVEGVRLLAAVGDPRTGGVLLRWSRYRGAGFAAYRLQRSITRSSQVDTLHLTAQISDTTYADTTAQVDIDYVYQVVTMAAGQQLLSNSEAQSLDLEPVVVTVELAEARPVASVRWSPYSGPRFQAYRVERRTQRLAREVLAEIFDISTATHVDTGLTGASRYYYRVTVVTSRDEQVSSPEVSQGVHEWLAEWPLDIDAGQAVRLYAFGDGLTALVSSPTRVRLLRFDSGGAVLADEVLLEDELLTITPGSVSLARGPQGQRFLSVASGAGLAILELDANGQLLTTEQVLFADSLAVMNADTTTIRGDIQVQISGLGELRIAAIQVTAGEESLLDGFEGWEAVNGVVENGGLHTRNLSPVAVTAGFHRTEREDITLTADLALRSTPFAIRLGRVLSRSIQVRLDPVTQTARLVAGRSYVSGERRFWSVDEPRWLLNGVPYKLRIGNADGYAEASLETPVQWGSHWDASRRWASLATYGDYWLVATAGEEVALLTPDWDEVPARSMGHGVSEMRSWQVDVGGRLGTQDWAGVCLPDAHRVLFHSVGLSGAGNLVWQLPQFAQSLGGAGSRPGLFFLPLSMDASPDGRLYVLDAGNERVQVFDGDGDYLTQWGSRGSGPGQLDLLLGGEIGGSIAVDDDGFIYVADVGNRRIQKFAP